MTSTCKLCGHLHTTTTWINNKVVEAGPCSDMLCNCSPDMYTQAEERKGRDK